MSTRARPRASALLVVLLAVAGCRERQASHDAGAPPAAPEAPTGAPTASAADEPVRIVYPGAPGTFVEVTRELREAVVHLRSTRKVSGGPATLYPAGADEHALGSGVLIDATGLILTNDHVIANAADIRVALRDGSELVAQVLGRDPRLDVALLKVEELPRRRVARLGDSDRLQVGEWVLALGNPFGTEVTASAGIVSALGRADAITSAGPPAGNFQSFLHTDAVINAANSGGPLVNTAGEVIGISSAKDPRQAGFGHAVPINRIKDILPMLREDGKVTRAWLGVFVHPVTAETARRMQLEVPTGALVSEVVPGSPAAKAGVRAGDVILRYDERAVDHRNLPWMAATSGISRHVPLTVWRSGAERKLTLLTEKMPE